MFFKVALAAVCFAQCLYPLATHFLVYKKMLLSRRLNSVLIFCLDVALKDSFPLAHQFDKMW